LKCGINTGYAIVGNIGTKKRAQFTAVGTTVNIASRLADICNSGQIIVSATTKSKVSNQFVCFWKNSVWTLANPVTIYNDMLIGIIANSFNIIRTTLSFSLF
jgi:adenylate cyclase